MPDHLIPNVQRLATQLQILRNHIAMPIIITSGYRTPEWNDGRGVEKSRHLTGEAADFRVKGVDVADLHRTISELIGAGKLHNGGLGIYLPNAKRRAGWVHLDVRPKPARWRG